MYAVQNFGRICLQIYLHCFVPVKETSIAWICNGSKQERLMYFIAFVEFL